jgi:hypothetical protein
MNHKLIDEIQFEKFCSPLGSGRAGSRILNNIGDDEEAMWFDVYTFLCDELGVRRELKPNQKPHDKDTFLSACKQKVLEIARNRKKGALTPSLSQATI